MPGQLFVVATPIGNLEDLSSRAITVLREVRAIVAEDTRHTRTLLNRFGIPTPTVSLPAFDESDRIVPLVARLMQGESLALVSDAGTPAISDPGEKLVNAAVAAGIQVIPIPGASASISALCASGLPTGRFHFLGFLPRKENDAREMLEEVKNLSATLILYESPKRVLETLQLLVSILGSRRAVVARELTKIHEEFIRGPLEELVTQFQGRDVLGEIVILVEGFSGSKRWALDELERALDEALANGDRLKGVSTELARRSGWPSHEIYRLGLARKK